MHGSLKRISVASKSLLNSFSFVYFVIIVGKEWPWGMYESLERLSETTWTLCRLASKSGGPASRYWLGGNSTGEATATGQD